MFICVRFTYDLIFFFEIYLLFTPRMDLMFRDSTRARVSCFVNRLLIDRPVTSDINFITIFVIERPKSWRSSRAVIVLPFTIPSLQKWIF